MANTISIQKIERAGGMMMGKTSKKVKRQMQKNNENRRLQNCRPREQELAAAFAAEDYTKVLDILAELITAGDIKPDLFYKGAYSYFMLGDYERAAQWVTNTLNYDSNHIDARILLARLCFMQDRHDDGLAIYDFLAENYRQTMTLAQKDQIMDSSECYVRREAEKLQHQYPHLAQFLQVAVPAASMPVVKPAASRSEKSTNEGKNALSALARLKAKLQAVQEKNAAEEAVAEPTVSSQSAAEVQPQAVKQMDDVAAKIAEIRQKQCSLREKVKILNQFAGAQYIAGDYAEAERFLKEALLLDEGDASSLRNMAMTQAAMGNSDKAQAYAANLPEVDFVLLYMLKEQANG